MTIKHVVVTNWKPPGEKWWAEAEAKPDEPLIECIMDLKLSHREYHDLLDRAKYSVSISVHESTEKA